MYNRYIPQPDGSYQKRRMQEPRPPEPAKKPSPPPKHKQEHCPPPIPVPEPCPPPKKQERHQVHCNRQTPCRQDSITGFFKQLLPKDLDTADLLIILLLLLMAGDCEEDRNNALLTLALYFFM
jgi:hypothetical protein